MVRRQKNEEFLLFFYFIACLCVASNIKAEKPKISIESDKDGSSIFIEIMEKTRISKFYLTDVGNIKYWQITNDNKKDVLKINILMYFTDELCQTAIIII
ncbi:MAG: hypothetical protein COU51_04410 [Parcubacteria group bacterium CG10_big_fil_rev_8_21_14_0_10_36_14]|nr:MAG: hypothetical protein COU51_04410 [Parcubacteria group bacterium CG10_big_fil_rev_8_21_14_0_10_36_14]